MVTYSQDFIDANRDINTEFEWWDGIYEDFNEELESLGFNDCTINFRGFYSQGDGACFDCNDFDINLMIDATVQDGRYRRRLKRIANDEDNFQLTISIFEVGASNIYCHENTRDIEVAVDDNFYWGQVTPKKVLEDMEYFNKFITGFEVLRYNMCKNIYARLEQEYDYITSDTAIIETLELNEMEEVQ